MCAPAVSIQPQTATLLPCASQLHWVAVAGLLCLPWLSLWWLFQDLGGWPLNDDPFYAKPLEFLASEGRLTMVRQYGHLTASSVAHILTGSLATVRGFDYRSLFLVCILQQALGAMALYFLARQLQLAQATGWLVAASLIAYPLYFGHAFTFMTDGPAAAWSSLGCVCLSLGWLRQKSSWILVGALAIGWGYWIRQTNGALLIAPCLLLALAWLGRTRLDWPTVWPLALAGLMILVLETGWVLPASSARANDIAPQSQGYWKQVLIAGYGWVLLTGWYVLPLAPGLAWLAWQQHQTCSHVQRLVCLAVSAGTILAAATPFVLTQARAHLTSATGAFIQNGHFGPIFLSDMDEPGRWGSLAGVQWPTSFWQILTGLAIFSAGSLAWWAGWTLTQVVGRSAGSSRPRVRFAFAWLVMIITSVAAICLLVEPHMDRYWLFLMPVLSVFCLLLAAELDWRFNRLSIAWAMALMALQVGMSSIFVHDMLAWNNARWQFVQAHLAAGNAADSIDAGRDVNAWLRMDEDPNTSARPGDTSRWWSGRANICIASGPRAGWHIHSQLPWVSWATGQTHFLLVLERSSSDG